MNYSSENIFAEMERLCQKYQCQDIFQVVKKLEQLTK